jgi:hypothetical protein
MTRTSKYFDLRFVVEVRQNPLPYWEAMAAFNVDSVAQAYAARCRQANPLSDYRVMERQARGWKELGAR